MPSVVLHARAHAVSHLPMSPELAMAIMVVGVAVLAVVVYDVYLAYTGT